MWWAGSNESRSGGGLWELERTGCGPWGAEGRVWPRDGGGAVLSWDLEAEPMDMGPRPVGSNMPFLPSRSQAFLLSHFIICLSAKKAF